MLCSCYGMHIQVHLTACSIILFTFELNSAFFDVLCATLLITYGGLGHPDHIVLYQASTSNSLEYIRKSH